MSVYTKTGDNGSTGLYTGERVEKDSLRVDAYGTVDEINSALGLARAFCEKTFIQEVIYKLQEMNMSLMAELASTSEGQYITVDHISYLESMIDQIDSKLPPLNKFLISGNSKGGAALDLARTVVRRAERKVWTLARNEKISQDVLIVLNRLSDLCFVLMRLEENSSSQ
ncbi:cob(I)yrinic acid a,c-diamide adenosyltransferase [Anaerosinus massiliensis]|uniref:cob(I)yrinic acid a,c-diamide adenosyltransferase n=1 Tax=Massilibacillus massiliensis TaxID=1806837 RepID=UPI000AD2875F|nr:cob(I)yrinic acid a,c-diamide adenosyltransferase [Massilibacillus massiliensis]